MKKLKTEAKKFYTMDEVRLRLEEHMYVRKNGLRGFFLRKWDKIRFTFTKDIPDLWYAIKCFFQKITVGYSIYELIELKSTFYDFIIPRLIAFKSKTYSYPAKYNSIEEWREVLDKMILSFHQLKMDDWRIKEEKKDVIDEGLKLFIEHLEDLWM